MIAGIRAEHISKSFNGHYVLKDFSLSVAPCESMVIMGQSGSGKSVFLKCLLGFSPVNSGSIFIGEHAVQKESAKDQEVRFSQSGVVFQSYALFDSLRLWQNVAFKMKGSERERREKAIAILSSVGIEPHRADLYPSEISGGMKRRASIARAIALSPKYLFFDEPTEGLDPVFANIISQLIRNVVTQLKATAITITHNVSCARYVGDKVALLHKGRIGWQGLPEEMEKPSSRLIYQFISGDPNYINL